MRVKFRRQASRLAANKIASAEREVRESDFHVRLKAKRFSRQVQRHR